MDKLISVIVPVYKVEIYLHRCVDSILGQTYSNLEVILVDDGSPDNCGAICDEYQKKDDRVKVIHKINSGLSDARNLGISEAKGDYLAFVDSDDFINERYIETLYSMCVENNAQISQCGFTKISDRNIDRKTKQVSRYEVKTYDSLGILRKLYAPQNIEIDVAWNKLYRRELFGKIIFPKGRIYEDFATTYRLFYKAEKIAVTEEPLYYYFMSDRSITRSGFYQKKFDFILTYEERLEFFKVHSLWEIYRNTLYSYYFALIRFYYICRKNCRDLKDKKREFRNKIKKTYQELRKEKQFSFQSKLKIVIAHLLPRVYYGYGMYIKK